jgi:hypothetical protein
MEPEKPKFNWKRLLITVSVVILTAGLFGGGVWYFMDQSDKKTKKANEDEIASLQKQINDLKADTTTTEKPTSGNTTTEETTSWKTYNNTVYSYSLKYPSSWTLTENSGGTCHDLSIKKPGGDVFTVVSGKTTCGRGMEGVRRFIKYAYTISGNMIKLGDNTLSETTELQTSTGSTPTSGYFINLTDAPSKNGNYYIVSMTGTNYLDSTTGMADYSKIVSTIVLN